MEVNWLTVLNKEQRGEVGGGVLTCFFVLVFSHFYHGSGYFARSVFTRRDTVPRKSKIHQTSLFPSFPLSSQPSILPPLHHIFSVIFHLLSFAWFHPPTKAWELLFSWNVSCCRGASWCNLLCTGENIRLHVCKWEHAFWGLLQC